MFVALPGDRILKLHPVLTAVVADTQEMAALTLTTGSNKSPRPDPSSLVTKERLADRWAASGAPRRSEHWMQRVRAWQMGTLHAACYGWVGVATGMSRLGGEPREGCGVAIGLPLAEPLSLPACNPAVCSCVSAH